MSKKVYTLTFHHVHNFGAMMQAYALQHTINKLGLDTQIIDYDLDKPSLYLPLKNKNNKEKIKNFITNIYALKSHSQWKKSYKLFEDFYHNNLNKTQKFNSIKDMQEYNFENAPIIVGSDQVWSEKSLKKNFEILMLSFLSTSNKYTYAVSMGDISEYHENENFLSKVSLFNGISVREKETEKFFTDHNISAIKNIDPIFLIDKKEWIDLANQVQNIENEDYILCYDLVKSDLTQKILNRLKAEYGYKTIVVTRRMHTELKADKILRAVGPLEILNLIIHAKQVVTTSFHGAAFAILFNINFYAITSSHSPKRIVELLDLFNLKSQLLDNNLNISEADFSSTKKIIDEEKTKSMEYLKNIIDLK